MYDQKVGLPSGNMWKFALLTTKTNDVLEQNVCLGTHKKKQMKATIATAESGAGPLIALHTQ